MIRELSEKLQGRESEKITSDEKLDWVLEHARRLMKVKGENTAMKEMRGHACWYIQGMPFNNRMKDLLAKINTYNQLERLLDSYRSFIVKTSDEMAEEAADFFENCREEIMK